MKTFRKLLLLISSLILIFGCNKTSENKGGEEPDQKCKIVKAVYFDNGVAYDSVDYLYTDTLLTRVNLNQAGRYYTFEYENGRISKRNHFINGSAQQAYTDISYNFEGKVDGLVVYDNNVLHRAYEFIYSSAKLHKVLTKYYSGGIERVEYEYSYTYTGNNISRSTIVQYLSTGNKTTIVDYFYDTEDNYFKKRSDAFLTDQNFFILEGTLYPYFFSNNNLISLIYDGTPGKIHQYITDSTGNLSEILLGGKVALRYKYECL